jgi:hypothetical protein
VWVQVALVAAQVQVEAGDVGPDMFGAGDGAAEHAVVGDALATAGASMTTKLARPTGPLIIRRAQRTTHVRVAVRVGVRVRLLRATRPANTAKRSVVADSPSLVIGQSGTQRLTARSKRLFEQSQCTRPEAVKTQ